LAELSAIKVSSSDLEIVVTSPEGKLCFNRDSGVVSLESNISYATFIKMVKMLKRSVNRLSFEVDFEDE
jgi:hypothetical protein